MALKRLSRLAATVGLIFASSPLMAADGWYLLIPPTKAYQEHAAFLNGKPVDTTAAISHWSQEGAYDSAQECEAVKDSLSSIAQQTASTSSTAYIQALADSKDRAALSAQRYTAELHHANDAALQASRCIKSDDPRLAISGG